MFWTEIRADLPTMDAEGADDGRGAQRVSYTTSRLLRVLRQVFEQAEVTDLAWLRVDGQVLRRDEEKGGGDLDALAHAHLDHEILRGPFETLEVMFSHDEEEMRHAVYVQVARSSVDAEPELTIVLSSRPDDVNARRLDDAARYAERLQRFAQRPSSLDVFRGRIERLAARLDGALETVLFRRRVDTTRVMLRLVRPTAAQIATLAEAPFGDRLTPPTYAVDVPPFGEPWPWPEPLATVEADPWRVARHVLLLDALVTTPELQLSWVEVVGADGRELFRGPDAARFAQAPWRRRFHLDATRGGGLTVRWLEPGAPGAIP
jgi:hypothetical protein